ncbi:MAG: carboxypeptidase regulatory-like domain-containing protein, partial [Mucilaginibacter sp.]
MRKVCALIVLLLLQISAYCQSADTSAFKLNVLGENLAPIPGATVLLLQDSKQVKSGVSDAKGVALFQNVRAGDYIFQVTSTGYQKRITHSYHFPSALNSDTVHLSAATTALQEVNITARKSYIQQKQGKTIINVGASVTNEGATVLEVLEKSPGVTVDQNGTISLKGKSSVLVMVDDKPTYLSPGDLNNLLSSMNSSQVDQIELMPNPPAKYDASGNAGVINIKTKKNKQKGFNGSFTSSIGHGIHPKNGENLTLNYRNGKINTFVNYNLNYVKYITDLYALRKYYDANTGQLTSMLSQPSAFTGTFVNNTVKAGLDYFVSPKTTVGLIVGATAIHRAGSNTATAT